MTSIQPFLEQSKLHPEKIAISQWNVSYTYGKLADLSQQLGNNISQIAHLLNSSTGCTIGIACGRSAEQIIGMFGTWHACLLYMPLNPDQQPAEIAYKLREAGSQILICNKADWDDYSLADNILNSIKYCICFISPSSWKIYRIENGLSSIITLPVSYNSKKNHNENAYIVFTSGTTGKPKAIKGRHNSLIHFMSWQTRTFGINESTKSSWLIQPTFDASFRDILLPLYNGGELCIPPQEKWELIPSLIKWADESQISVLHTVPSFFRLLLNEIEAGYRGISLFKSLKFIFLSGESLYKNDIVRWQMIFGNNIQLINLYGCTETTLISLFYAIPDTNLLIENIIPAGKPISNTDIFVIQEQKICDTGTTGEIFFRSDYFTSGYLKDMELVSPFIADFIDIGSGKKLYNTGDLGFINAKGDLVVTGRSDDQIKKHGIRIHTAIVEDIITENFNFSQIAVVLDTNNGILKAFYSPTDKPDFSLIRPLICEKLSEHHVPDVWIPLTEFPLSANGKVDRKYLSSYSTPIFIKQQKSDCKPVSETEKAVCKNLANILKQKEIGLDSNFFEMGGNSLNGLIFISRIHKELKKKVTLRELFSNPRVSDLALLLDKASTGQIDMIRVQNKLPYYQLSQAQRRMWILHNMEENSITYNIKRAYEISGELCFKSLTASFQLIIDKQESLRTNFKVVEGIPVQFIRNTQSSLFELTLTDLCSLDNPESIVRKMANNEVQYHFNLETESLIRARIIKLQASRWVLLINMHHIISDGWSMEILLKDLFGNYDRILAGEIVLLESISFQYKDYALWQQNNIDSNAYHKERTYWLNEFSGELPIIELPADYSRSKIKTYNGGLHYFRINGLTKKRIDKLCLKYDVSLYMFLLSCVKVLLYKYSGQKDLIIGSPIAGREHPDLDGIIGFFVNMLAIRTLISDDVTFEQYLQMVRDKTFNAFENQAYSFDKLVEELSLQRNTSRSPLFDITVQVLNVEFWEKADNKSSINLKPFIVDWQRSQFDLSFFFKEENSDSIFALIEYNNSIYNSDRIERMVSHFNVLLNQLLTAPEIKIGKVNYISKYENQQIVYKNNDVHEIVIPFENVIDAIINNSSPEKIAIKGLNRDISYGELKEFSINLAQFLIKIRQEKKPIGILISDRVYLISAMVGTMMSGNIYLPLDPDYPCERLKYVINDSGAEMIITTKLNLPLADKLLWECNNLKGYICVDSNEVLSWIPGSSELMRQDLWNYVGKQAKNEIEAGGWISSYTGLPFSKTEMEEYADNALIKIKPYLTDSTKVLEIGCSSGLTLFKIAPLVGSYFGIDLSDEILNKTRQRVKEKGLMNVTLITAFADEIDKYCESEIDIIIINSVIQSFGSYNYFRDIIRKILKLSANNAILFLGDIQDVEKKDCLIASLSKFKTENLDTNLHAKLTWDEELFFHKEFLSDLSFEYPELASFSFSDKIGLIKNELSLFRFDALIYIDKTNTIPWKLKKHKWQFGLNDFPKQHDNGLIKNLNKNNIAYIIYTSGTSGNPKGVMINHQSLINTIYSIGSSFKYPTGHSDNVLMVCRSTFDLSILEILTGLVFGATLFEVDNSIRLSADWFVKTFKENDITWSYIPPSLISDIANEIKRTNTTVKLNKLIVGVEPITCEALRNMSESCPGLDIINGYGPTETTIVSTIYKFNKNDLGTIVPIGKPLPGYKIFIVDSGGNPTGVGIKGEIVISGAGVSEGYINNPKLTEEKFRRFLYEEKAYFTGDMGFWDTNGNIHFSGRIDRQVKHKGYRIELPEIEEQISSYPGVLNALALIVSLDDELKQLVLFIKSAADNDEQELKKYIASKLPEHLLPQRIISLKDFPLTPHGKTDFKKLESLVYSSNKVLTNSDMPIGYTEKSILELYRSLLKQPNIGIHDNFFEIGGHSLIATRLVTRSARDYGLNIPLVNVFIHPTVRELSRSLKESKHEEVISKIEKTSSGLYPLSYAQSRLWVIDHLNKDDDGIRAIYNMSGLFEVNGIFNIELFKNAILLVIKAHESLRTNFTFIDGEPFQKINEEAAFNIITRQIPYHIADINQYLREEIAAIVAQPFDLEKDTLLRSVFFLGADSSFILFLMHHIISDGWSMHVFSTELVKALNYLKGGADYLPPAIQYKDFAAWNRHAVEENTESKEYWHKLLAESLPPTWIPSFKPRSSWRTFNGKTARVDFDPESNKHIRNFCSENQVTLYSFLVTVLNVLIYRYTGLKKITIGSPVSGRTHYSLENQIGFYLNNIVVRTEVNGNDSFIYLLETIHQQILSALKYQEYPFDKLVDDLLTERDTSHSPFFDIYLVVQNNESPVVNFGDFCFTPIDFEQNISRYDLCFAFNEKDGLKLELQYNSDLYDELTINRLIKHIIQLIISSTGNPDYSVAKIPIHSENEIIRFLSPPLADPINDPSLKSECNEINERAGDTILFYFNKVVTDFPDNIALVYRDTSLTYQMLDIAATNLAIALINNGIKKGDIVALGIDRNLNRIIGIIAVLKTGASYLPFDIKTPVTRINRVIGDAGSKLFLTDQLPEHFDDPIIVPVMHSFINLLNHESIELPVINGNDTAYILYTSGTTGKPKGVAVSHTNVVSLIKGNNFFDFSSYEVWTQFHQYNWDFTVWEIWGALFFGGKLVIVPTEFTQDLNYFVELIVSEKITVLNLTPPVFAMISESLLSLDCNDLASLKYINLGGDTLKYVNLIPFSQKYPWIKLIFCYGITETTVLNTSKLLTEYDLQGNKDNIGKSIHNSNVYILDENLQFVPNGMAGQLAISGKCLSKGYLNDPELTSLKFIDHPVINETIYLSGDMARFLPNGDIEFLGRMDHQVKIRGHRIELGEIESTLRNISYIKNAIVLKSENSYNAYLLAFVIPSPAWKDNLDLLKNINNINNEQLHLSILQNDLPVFHNPQNQSTGIYREIMEMDIYKLHNLNLGENPVIIDALAGTGLFSVIASYLWNDAFVYSWETSIDEYKYLKANAALHSSGRIIATHIPVANPISINSNSKANGLGINECDNEFYLNSNKLYSNNNQINRIGSHENEEQNENWTESYYMHLLNSENSISGIINKNKIKYIGLLRIELSNWDENNNCGILPDHWNIVGNVIAKAKEDDPNYVDFINFLELKGFNVEANKGWDNETSDWIYIRATNRCGKQPANELNKNIISFAKCQYNWITVEKLIQKIKSELASILPQYMVPTRIILVDNFPLTTNGKLDRNALLKAGKNKTDIPVSQIELTDKAKELLKIISEVLQKTIYLDNNFFEIGGNSLNATKVITRIRARINNVLKIRNLFEYPIIKDLASYIESLPNIELVASTKMQETANINDFIQPVEKSGYYPLSSAQYRLWMVHKVEGGSHAYLVPCIFNIEGIFNVHAFQSSIGYLFEKHEILRTIFIEDQNMPYQQVLEDIDPALYFTYWNDITDIDLKINEILDIGLLLEGNILFHCHVFRITDLKYRILIILHHINADGVTVSILRKDLAVFYNYCSKGEPVKLDIPKIQYKDFSAWHNMFIDSPECVKQKDYWLNVFSDTVPTLDMPCDFIRPANHSFRGRSVEIKLDLALSNKIESIAISNKISIFSVFISLVKTILWRHSGQDDIIVGTPIDLRINTQLENQAGQYLNTLPLRDKLNEEQSFLTLMQEVHLTLISALENKLYPFEKIISNLNLPRDTGRSPLFSVLVVMHNFEVNSDELGHTKWTNVANDNDTSKFDYVFYFSKEITGFKINLRYCTDLFLKPRAEALLSDIFALAEGICFDSGKRLKAYPLQYNKKLHENSCSNFQAPQFNDVIDLFIRSTFNTPSLVAVEYGEQRVTYLELYQIANTYAKLCSGRAGHRIVVAIPPSPDWVAALIGVWIAGKSYIPIDPSIPEAILIAQLKQIKPDAIIADNTHLNHCSNLLKKAGFSDVPVILCPDQIVPSSDVVCFNENYIEEAYIVFTSGSTGEAKGISGNRRSISHFINWEIKMLNIDYKSGTKIAQLTQPTFDASFRDIFVALATSNTIVIPLHEQRKDLVKLLEWINSSEVNIVHIVPSFLRALISVAGPVFPNHISHILCAGEQLLTKDVENIYSKIGDKIEVYNLYGPSEATLVKTYWNARNPWNLLSLPAGTGIDDTMVLILNEAGTFCSPGEFGEIYLRTPYLSNGYIDKNMNKDCFIQNPLHDKYEDIIYRTGDVGRFGINSELILSGRNDEQVKINGIRVDLKEIEFVAANIKGIDSATAKAWQRNQLNSIALYFTSTEISEEILVNILKDRLMPFSIPFAIIRLEKMPLNANGKTDKKALPDPFLFKEEVNSESEQIDPLLIALWSDTLKIEFSRININADFFKSGGNSLTAMILLSKVNQATGIIIPIKEFFNFPTLSYLQKKLPSQRDIHISKIVKLAHSNSYPVSHAQQRLWILNEMEMNNISYNIKNVYSLSGNVNIAAMKHSLYFLINRHESLRTSFQHLNGRINQIIYDYFDIEKCFVFIDISAHQKNEEKKAEIIESFFIEPFRLDSYPLIKVCLVQTADSSFIFAIKVHHIIADGWSMEVLAREFTEVYNSIEKGLKYSLPELPFQYKDFASWQNENTNNEKAKADEQYWLEKLNHLTEPIILPSDRPRFEVKTFNGDYYVFHWDSELSNKLKILSENHNVTLFMIILGALKSIFYRYTGQDDIIVGVPTAGRHFEGLENQIGLFINTLALRSKIDPQDNFADLLIKIKQTTLEALDHQDIPFDTIVDKLQLKRRLDHSPIFDILVQVMNTNVIDSTLSFDGLVVDSYSVKWHTSQFDQSYAFIETDSGINGSIEYNTDLFDKSTIIRQVEHLRLFLFEILINPGSQICNVNFLTPEEKLAHIKLKKIDSTYPLNPIYQQFENVASRLLEKTAIITSTQKYTYKYILYDTQKLSALLYSFSNGEKYNAALLFDEGYFAVTAMLSCCKIGLCYVPFGINHPFERLKYIANDSEVKILIFQKEYYEIAIKLFEECDGLKFLVCTDSTDIFPEADRTNQINLGLDTEIAFFNEHNNNSKKPYWYNLSDINEIIPINNQVNINIDTPAYIIYTSGSTGNPKGCIISHRNVMSMIFSDKNPCDFSENDVFIQSNGYHFDSSVWEIFGSLFYGASLVIPQSNEIKDVRIYYDLLRKHKVTIMDNTPQMFYNFSNFILSIKDSYDISKHLRLVSLGGEKLQTPKLLNWIKRFPNIKIMNMYGPTETTVNATYHTITLNEIEQMPFMSIIGIPFPETCIYLKDNFGNDVPFNVNAELVIGGTSVGQGYYNKNDLTNEKFIQNKYGDGQNVYLSGDYCKMLPDGNIAYLNRVDSQVKVRGYRIEVNEIESVILNHKQVEQAVVILTKDHTSNDSLVAFYVGKLEDNIELKKYISIYLPSYMIPEVIIRLDEIPLNINGKLDFKKLTEISNQYKIKPIDENETFSETALIVKSAFCDALGIKRIGLRDNFFDFGGNSLKAMNLISLLYVRKRAGVPLVYLYKFPRVKEIADYIDCASFMNVQNKEHSYMQLGNPEGRKTLFMFPPALGYALAYNHLSTLLDDVQLYSFNYVDSADTLQYYVTLINELQPEGALFIAGHSAGGFMAFHMAKAMEKSGRKVGGVIILDVFRQGKEGNLHTYESMKEGTDLFLANKFDELKEHFIDMNFFKEICYTQVKQYYDFLYYAENDGDNFIQSPIHLLISESNYEKQENWSDFTAGGVKSYLAHGLHDKMVDEPWVNLNAQILNNILNDEMYVNEIN